MSTDAADFALTDTERNSALWLRLSEHLRDRLAQHRARNDNAQPLEDTAALRGRIAEVKAILSLNDE